jgi:uncharacterized protein (TIGR03083 family)
VSDAAFAVYGSAATVFAELVHQLPTTGWDGPGLGDWDLRALVGHASRSLTTVSTYLKVAAAHEDVASAEEYYVKIRAYAADLGAADILERGRQAGRDLGPDPAATVDALLARVLAELDGAGDPLIGVIGGLGIRLSNYLPTRTFELAVHGLDIIRATGLQFALPEQVLEEATVLAARVSVALGQGESVLLSLTGRCALPVGFSAV